MLQRTILFVPGFLKESEDVSRANSYVEKLNNIFGQHGWNVIMASCYLGACHESIDTYSRRLETEIDFLKPDVIISHSMGTLVVRGSWKYFKDFAGPIVFIEGPNAGVSWWKLLLFLNRYPFWRVCMRDTMRGSVFMKSIQEDSPPQDNRVLEIQGKFSENPLARNVFVPLRYAQLKKFPRLGHRGLAVNDGVIKIIADFINQ